jgi:hypothetical protein
MISATSSGPAATIAASISPSRRRQNASGSSPSGARNALVLDTCVTSIGARPNGALKRSTPVNDSAPSVTPWYATSRAIAFVRCGCSLARWNSRRPAPLQTVVGALCG